MLLALLYVLMPVHHNALPVCSPVDLIAETIVKMLADIVVTHYVEILVPWSVN